MVYYRIFGAWKKRNKSADEDFTPSVNENAHRNHVIV